MGHVHCYSLLSAAPEAHAAALWGMASRDTWIHQLLTTTCVSGVHKDYGGDASTKAIERFHCCSDSQEQESHVVLLQRSSASSPLTQSECWEQHLPLNNPTLYEHTVEKHTPDPAPLKSKDALPVISVGARSNSRSTF